MAVKKRICLIVLFITITLVFSLPSSLSVICRQPTVIWALPPYSSVENVQLEKAQKNESFRLRGIYTDVTGHQWYIVTPSKNTGTLKKAYISKEDCFIEFGH